MLSHSVPISNIRLRQVATAASAIISDAPLPSSFSTLSPPFSCSSSPPSHPLLFPCSSSLFSFSLHPSYPSLLLSYLSLFIPFLIHFSLIFILFFSLFLYTFFWHFLFFPNIIFLFFFFLISFPVSFYYLFLFLSIYFNFTASLPFLFFDIFTLLHSPFSYHRVSLLSTCSSYTQRYSSDICKVPPRSLFSVSTPLPVASSSSPVVWITLDVRFFLSSFSLTLETLRETACLFSSSLLLQLFSRAIVIGNFVRTMTCTTFYESRTIERLLCGEMAVNSSSCTISGCDVWMINVLVSLLRYGRQRRCFRKLFPHHEITFFDALQE